MTLRKHKTKIQIKELGDGGLLIYGEDLTPEWCEVLEKVYDYGKKRR